MSEGCDVSVPECDNAMTNGSGLSLLVSVLVLEGLPGMLVPGQVILISLLLPNAMGMRAGVVQFFGTLVVLVMGSAVMTSGHIKNVNARQAPSPSEGAIFP